jgi:hypothetical protein
MAVRECQRLRRCTTTSECTRRLDITQDQTHTDVEPREKDGPVMNCRDTLVSKDWTCTSWPGEVKRGRGLLGKYTSYRLLLVQSSWCCAHNKISFSWSAVDAFTTKSMICTMVSNSMIMLALSSISQQAQRDITVNLVFCNRDFLVISIVGKQAWIQSHAFFAFCCHALVCVSHQYLTI